MIYLGLDASTSCTGICVFEDRRLTYYNKIKPKTKGDFRHNACEILDEVVKIADKYRPDIIFMEDVPTFAKQGSRGGNIMKPMITLGAVQGMFYYELSYNRGYKIQYIDVHEWRAKLGFLKGSAKDRTRDKQKAKAVEYVNNLFGLELYYVEGKKSVKDDDDIAEAIALTCSKI